MPKDFTIEERKRFATQAGVNEPYLYQCLTGRRDMGPAEARRVEAATGGELHLWDLCQMTWGAIWPELLARKGAPKYDETKAHAEAMRQTKAAA